MTSTSPEHSSAAPRTDGSRPTFPRRRFAVLCAGVAVGVVGELATPEHTNHTRGVAVLLAVLPDIAFLLWLAPRVEDRSWSPTRTVLFLLAANAAFGVVAWLAIRGLLVLTVPHEPARLLRAAGGGLLWGMELYALWAVGFQQPDLVGTSRARKAEAMALREQAELMQLRAHLQPHFLRNTLNAVSALVTEDPDAARRMLATLADLLSEMLETSDTTHPLKAEIAWLQRYASILEARHPRTLSFGWHLEAGIAEARIPRRLLQPLVENAALHGALERAEGGHVEVRATVGPRGGVQIVVQDNGPGMSASPRTEGLGRHLVQRRVEMECPGSRFEVDTSSSGTVVTVHLP